MTPRDLAGYVLLALLLLAVAWGILRWRRDVRRDRLMRWGTPHGPGRARRRGRD